MSDTDKIRLSFVLNRELDPDVFDILASIDTPRVRSEMARRMLTAGAQFISGQSQKKMERPKPSPKPESDSVREIQVAKGKVEKQQAISVPIRSEVGTPSAVIPATVGTPFAPTQLDESDEFSASFAASIRGVPTR